MDIEAFIFDLDGTLVHTKPQHRYELVGRTLDELGVASYSKEQIDRFWFEGRREEKIKKCFGLEPEVFWKTYKKYDSNELRERFTEVYDDVDFIGELKKNGYKVSIVTGAPRNILELEIGMVGKEFFDSVVRAQLTDGIHPKPSPHGIEKCLDSLRVSNEKSVYIGNSDEDILAAKGAGVFDVLLDRNEYEFDLEKIKPSLVIESLYDLRDLL